MGYTLRRLHQSWFPFLEMECYLISPRRSNDYSYNSGITSDWKALLLNKVVVGKGKKLTRDDTTITQPPAGFDSVSVLYRFLARVLTGS